MIKMILNGICHVLCINCMQLIVKIFCLRIWIVRGLLWIQKNIFFLGRYVLYYIKKNFYKAIIFKYNE